MAQVNVTGLQSNTANRIKAQQNNSQGAINEGTATAQAAFDAEVSAINKLNTNMLSYPMDTAAFSQGHYVIFQIHDLTTGRLVKEEKEGGFKKRSFALKGGGKRVGTQIALYMPPSVQVQYKSKYGDAPIGATAEAALTAIQGIKNAEGFMGTTGSVLKGVGQVGSAGVKTMASASAGLTSGSLAPGLKELAFINAGKIVTDKMELIFEGVERRNFNFEFNFIPKSKAESVQVDRIVNAFKIAMLPEYTSSFGGAVGTAIGVGNSGGSSLGATDTGADRTLSIPTTMDIKYYMQKADGAPVENRYLNRISSCYLQDMQVEFGGERYTAYEYDGSKGSPPQHTKITLDFNEIEIITKEAAKVFY